MASHATHQVCPPWTPSSLHIGPTARPMMPSPSHRIQHNHPSAAHSQIGPAGAQHLSVQLVVGLSDRKTSGSTGRH